MPILLALLMGVIAGLRALTPLAVVSWGAKIGALPVQNTFLAFLGYEWTAWVLTLAAIGEIINDKLPKTPSRKTPPQFITRVVTGALSGGAVGTASGSLTVGLVAGAIGAVIGTLGGAQIRGTLARSFGRDLPAALIEDGVAVIAAFLIIRSLMI